jgi:hypothetical protein
MAGNPRAALSADAFEHKATEVARAFKDAIGDPHEAALVARRVVVLLEVESARPNPPPPRRFRLQDQPGHRAEGVPADARFYCRER